MNATILKFPPGGRRFDIRVERETNGTAWLVRTHDREWGWLHGDFESAQQDAVIIARGYGVGVCSSAGRLAP